FAWLLPGKARHVAGRYDLPREAGALEYALDGADQLRRRIHVHNAHVNGHFTNTQFGAPLYKLKHLFQRWSIYKVAIRDNKGNASGNGASADVSGERLFIYRVCQLSREHRTY